MLGKRTVTVKGNLQLLPFCLGLSDYNHLNNLIEKSLMFIAGIKCFVFK